MCESATHQCFDLFSHLIFAEVGWFALLALDDKQEFAEVLRAIDSLGSILACDFVPHAVELALSRCCARLVPIVFFGDQSWVRLQRLIIA